MSQAESNPHIKPISGRFTVAGLITQQVGEHLPNFQGKRETDREAFESFLQFPTIDVQTKQIPEKVVSFRNRSSALWAAENDALADEGGYYRRRKVKLGDTLLAA